MDTAEVQRQYLDKFVLGAAGRGGRGQGRPFEQEAGRGLTYLSEPRLNGRLRGQRRGVAMRRNPEVAFTLALRALADGEEKKARQGRHVVHT